MSWLVLAAAVLVMPRRGLRPPRTAGRRAPAVRLNAVAAVAAGCLCLVLLPLPLSAAVAVPACLLAWRRVPRSGADPTADRQLAIARELPTALHLAAALIRAGCTDSAALAHTADAVRGPLGELLAEAARLRELGATTAEAYRQAAAEPQLRSFAAAMVRRSDSGASIAVDLERLAGEARADYFTRAQVSARAAAVRSVMPLALCFLPSFLLLGVVPIVAALGTGLGF